MGRRLIVEFDSFRIIIDLIDNITNNKQYLYSLFNDSYPDAFLKKEYLVANKKKIELIIKNSTLGIFVIKKIIDKFHPWIKIFGQKQLIKPDFPKEFWKPINEGGIGKKWSKKVEKRIKGLNWKI